MGNYRFRLSDMLPNAWFYKLRDMSNTKTNTNHHHHKKKPPLHSSYYSSSTNTTQNHPRNYYTPKLSQFHNSPKSPHFHDPPRNSSKRLTPNRKTIYKPSPKHTSLTESTHTFQDFFHSPFTNHSPSSESTQSALTSCTRRLSSSTSDIIIDVIDVPEPRKLKLSPEKDPKLAPIITKPSKPASRTPQDLNSGKKLVKQSNQIPARKSVSGLKLRSNSPKLALLNKRIVQKSSTQRIKNMPESFAVVKSSFDPEKDFMESMMEMIMENNIRGSKGLEELLACYLSLNSDEYHDVIVKAFEQIWFTLPDAV